MESCEEYKNIYVCNVHCPFLWGGMCEDFDKIIDNIELTDEERTELIGAYMEVVTYT